MRHNIITVLQKVCAFFLKKYMLLFRILFAKSVKLCRSNWSDVFFVRSSSYALFYLEEKT